MKCSMEGCNNSNGPEALEIKHQGEVTDFVCENCLGRAKGLKLFLKKGDDGLFRIEQLTHLENPH